MKIISTRKILGLVLKHAFPQLGEIRTALLKALEESAIIGFQIAEMEPEVDAVKLKIKRLESDIDDVKRSFEKFQDLQKMNHLN